jgi:hypothetical protein
MRLFSVVIFVDNIAITCMVMKSLPQLGQLERAVSIVDMESIACASWTQWTETQILNSTPFVVSRRCILLLCFIYTYLSSRCFVHEMYVMSESSMLDKANFFC